MKTINISNKEIHRRNDRKAKSVAFELNEGLKSQLISVINKAKNQLNSFQSNVNRKIAYVVIKNDDWQPEAQLAIKHKAENYVKKMNEQEIEVVLHVT